MKKIKLGLVLLPLPFAAQAACVGTGNFFTCSDATGNSYTVTKTDNTTIVQGVDARTGRTWNQTSQSLGNTVSSSGTTLDGRTWTELTTTFGWDSSNTVTAGTDPNGNGYALNCTLQFGCL